MMLSNNKVPGYNHFSEKKIIVDDIDINYAEAGTGKSIIFIHGWTNNWTGLIPLAIQLIGNFRVILMDLPGYGDSGRLKKYNAQIQAEYVHKFAKSLGLEKYSVAAHSMGCFVTAKLQQKYHKEIEKIILIGAVFREGRKVYGLKLSENLYKLTRKSKLGMKIFKKIIDRKIYSYLTSKYINMYKFDKKIIDNYGMVGKLKLSEAALVDMGIEISRLDNKKMLTDNKVPILFIYGKYDKITNGDGAKKIMEGLGNYNFVDIDKAGHIAPVEKPSEVAKAIAEFIN